MIRLFKSFGVFGFVCAMAIGMSAPVYAAESTAYDPAWAQALSQAATERSGTQALDAQAAAQAAAQQQAAAQALAQQQAAAQAAAQQQAAAQALAQQQAAAQAAAKAQQAAAQAAANANAQAGQAQAMMSGTYVDVSIDTQTLTYFVNGTPVIITPCVTGSPGRSTPRGVFAINTMTPGKYLTGPSWHVWVNRWMRFSGNCGIHDANWRSKFGGDIYRHNGSHGCVNIPKDQAYTLYSMVTIGTPVIVH